MVQFTKTAWRVNLIFLIHFNQLDDFKLLIYNTINSLDNNAPKLCVAK